MEQSETSPEASPGFANLGLDPRLLSALSDLGYEEPSPIQREAIPQLLTGKDLIGQAATGTGKTAAFALPTLQRIAEMGKDRRQPSAMVLVPTRELAMQVAEAIHKYGQKLKVSVTPIYGGHSFSQQHRVLERGVDVVVATPGRALDHIRRKTLDLSGIAILVLDEADEMLDMGFADDLEAILKETPEQRQSVLFSATLPPRIAGMVKRYLKDPTRIQIASEPVAKGAAPKVRQTAYIIPRNRKLEVLGRILDLENPASALVFCRTRTEVDNLTERLSAHGYRAQALHGGITQDQRTRVIKRLREGAIDLVIATDVAARGLDIENLELVVNFDVPTSPDSYVHRIGRVGRAGREGVAISLADPRESRLLKLFERQTKSRIDVAQVPTVADLRARRLELTRNALRDTIAAGGLDQFRVCVESLAQEHDLMDVALAAVKLAHQAAGGDREDEEDDIPFDHRDDRPRNAAPWDGRPSQRREPRADRKRPEPREDAPPTIPPPSVQQPKEAPRPAAPMPPQKLRDIERPAAPRSVVHKPDRPVPAKPAPAKGPTARIYMGIGKSSGARPQDIVDAIVVDAKIPPKQIGTIEMDEKYSIVTLPMALVEPVVQAMKRCKIKERKVVVRRFVEKKV